MERTADDSWRSGPRTVVGLGVFAVVLGVLTASLYPASVLLGDGMPPAGLPRPSTAHVILPSAVLAPLLVTWGAFAARYRTLTPLTLRRSLLAPLLSVLVSVAGLGAFAYEWIRRTPFEVPSDTGGDPRTVDYSLQHVVQLEFGVPHLVALAVVAATVVGTVTVRRGWRAGLASAAVPALLTALSVTDTVHPATPVHEVVLLTAFLSAIALAVGSAAASQERAGLLK